MHLSYHLIKQEILRRFGQGEWTAENADQALASAQSDPDVVDSHDDEQAITQSGTQTQEYVDRLLEDSP